MGILKGERGIKMKRIVLFTGLICASTLLFVGCAQKLGMVSAPAGAETVARLDLSGASGLFIAQENDVSAMKAMGIMSNAGTRAAAKKPAALYKVVEVVLGNNGNGNGYGYGNLKDKDPAEVVEPDTDPVVEPTPDVVVEPDPVVVEPAPEVVVEPVVAYNQYDQPVDISGLEILSQKLISKFYILTKVRSLTDGSIFYWLIQTQTGKVFQFGEDINDSSLVSLMFQKESAANEFYKYYYLNKDGRVICMELNIDSVSKTTLATIKGFDYRRAKIDNNDNVILGTKFIKSDGISDGIGGYEYIDFNGNAAKMYVSKTGAFNYLTTDAIYNVYVDESNKVVSSLLYNVDPANVANSYIPQAHYSLPSLEINGYKYYIENKLSDYTNTDSVNRGSLLIKYDDKVDIKTLEYSANTVIILGDNCFYVLKDKSTIEKIDLDLNQAAFYSTNEYDMTTISYEGSNVVFYGYQYSNGSAIKGTIQADGTASVTTEALILPESIEKLIPIN